MSSRKDLANAIRALSMDAVQKAKSGHPGAPMGMADIAEVLWNDHMKHNPGNPKWFDRDRFVLSNGHGSMLIYSLLHLTGYDLSIDDLKAFRQLHSKTPGHPEYGYTPGVETTTGPLGQGITNAVGMALAERTLAAQFNRPGHDIVDHYTYVFLGDGWIHEAKSVNNKPTLICCKTVIGYGAPNLCGSQPLGEDEIKATRENLGWPYPPFEIPDEIYAGWDAREKGKAAEEHWNEKFAAYKAEFPELAAEFERRMKGELPENWERVADDYIKATDEAAESPATRQASQKAITAYAKALPEFLGGSADLTPSNLTAWPEARTITDTVADGD